MTKERPILFSTPMVQAILNGRKTQTRRLVKDCDGLTDEMIKDEKVLRFMRQICPYGEKGDKLWVRETWQTWVLGWIYKASYGSELGKGMNWKPSIHMPRVASRITLVITDIRIERLHDICADDAIDEGIEKNDPYKWKDYTGEYSGFDVDCDLHSKYGERLSAEVASYASLWAKINGLESWLSNPWVWVVTFEKEGGLNE